MKGMEYRSDVADVDSDLLRNPERLSKICEGAAKASGAEVIKSYWVSDAGTLVLTISLKKGGSISLQAFIEEGLLILNILACDSEVDSFHAMDGILTAVGGRLTFRDSAGRFRDLSDREGC